MDHRSVKNVNNLEELGLLTAGKPKKRTRDMHVCERCKPHHLQASTILFPYQMLQIAPSRTLQTAYLQTSAILFPYRVLQTTPSQSFCNLVFYAECVAKPHHHQASAILFSIPNVANRTITKLPQS
jgi:hypothetical protein